MVTRECDGGDLLIVSILSRLMIQQYEDSRRKRIPLLIFKKITRGPYILDVLLDLNNKEEDNEGCYLLN